MTEPILRLENVSYAYPDGPDAVKNLSVSIEKGERVAVLGRNGAGKSTFFLLCNGVLEPETGRIFCAGKPVTRKKQDLLELRRRVGIVFQEAENQILAVTVEGEVSFGPLNLGLPLPEVERRLSAELGVPVAAFSADQADPAEWNPAQLATRLDALSEQMERRTL